MKRRTPLKYMLIAVGFNLLAILGSFTALSAVYLFLRPHLPAKLRAWGIPLLFAASLALSLGVFAAAFKWILKKIKPEPHPENPPE